ncbi:hypothetical protein QR97_05060 [Streptomyces sp. PBH53]|uniref:hypothetical protein n=1 Tax=Streptomyces sp. PBH53 TaxID=1577075 RepID=UPI000655E176|nr:hypothetical protein [Streptomyces sp. PBH53]AKN69270.1 hypothetical protein QR97_05060 [Streptomyces sp. PBH53]
MAPGVGYANLNTSDLPRRGMTPATAPVHVLLVDLEADLVVRDGDWTAPVAREVLAAEPTRFTDAVREGVAALGADPAPVPALSTPPASPSTSSAG